MYADVEVREPVICADFKCKASKQKILLDMLIHYGLTDYEKLSVILDVPVTMIKNVHNGIDFLDYETSRQLGILFLLSFGE